jgi:hypothetical protein
MAKPVFICIQGVYLINLAHITSIEINIDGDGVITDYEVTTSDGNGAYTVDDPAEMKKLRSLIEVVY